MTNLVVSDSTSIRFEQSPELNKYVDPTIPLTWAVRWNALNVGLPVLLISSLLMAEMLAYRLWLDDRSLLSNLHVFLGVAAVPVAFLLVVLEVTMRLSHRSKRTLKLGPKRIAISPAKYNQIRWQNIKTWQIEPLAGAGDLSKLTLEYSLSKRATIPRRWSMVLERREQERAFLSALETFRQSGANAAPLTQLTSPELRVTPRLSMRPMVALAIAFYLFAQGAPLLAVGLSHSGSRDAGSSSNSELTPRERAKLQHFISRHFTSKEQLIQVLLTVGGGMTSFAAVLYVYALYSMKTQRKAPQLLSEQVVEH
jgi:hypothetical protein